VNILVLGGHGFIGSHIVEALIHDGHNIRVFARHPAEFICDAEWFSGDFLDQGKLAEALIGIDAVVHCISTTVPATSAANYIYDIESNLIGTVELLRLMKEQGVYRLIYLSSGGTVYGNPVLNPVPENAALNPISSYGAVKVSIEKFIEVSKISWGIKPVILRPSNPFGERQGHKGVQGLISTVLNNVIDQKPTVIYGNGSAIRDYIYVKDLSKLVCKVLDSDRCGVYNAGSGHGYNINEVIETIESVTGVTVKKQNSEARGFDVSEIVLDNILAEKHFGWKASVSLSSGIEKQFNWMKKLYASSDR
jgi:UDP-glucose 4-epimerase